MRTTIVVFGSAVVLGGFAAGWSAGCAASSRDASGGRDSGAHDDAPGPTSEGGASQACPACLSDTDCKDGWLCAQFQGDIFCAPPCGAGSACAAGRTCSPESSFNGDQISVCTPDDDACGMPAPQNDGGTTPPPGCDAGSSSTMCGTLVGPTVSSGCHSCTPATNATCTANGCYGGWWCDTSTDKCQAPPTSCPSPCASDDAGGPEDDAGPVTGTVTASGGSLSALRFAVVGDTRPANEDDTSGYPTAIIQTIFEDLQAASSPIPFALSTGDYQYANPTGTQSKPQLDLYVAARAKYSGVTFAAMGNHECTGYTDSNCGAGSASGDTSNYDNFLSLLLAPIGQKLPYYSINIESTTAGAWTSKFVFIAANAWDSAQSTWLSTTLAAPTTYTFVIRHEATEANTAPGVTPSDAIIAKYPLTLEINGHTHTYEWSSTNKVIVGNGGAPLTGGGDYGYALIQQQSTGDISIDMIDYKTGSADASFHRVLSPTGAEVP